MKSIIDPLMVKVFFCQSECRDSSMVKDERQVEIHGGRSASISRSDETKGGLRFSVVVSIVLKN